MPMEETPWEGEGSTGVLERLSRIVKRRRKPWRVAYKPKLPINLGIVRIHDATNPHLGTVLALEDPGDKEVA